jgi:alkyl hydroperoxide reductase subunit AhpC
MALQPHRLAAHDQGEDRVQGMKNVEVSSLIEDITMEVAKKYGMIHR